MKNGIILCSGGIDSVTTLFYAKKVLGYKEIIVLFFDYGQKSLIVERKASKYASKIIRGHFLEVKLDFIKSISTSLINKEGEVKRINNLKDTKKESEKFYVPCRNTIFLINAIALAESKWIKDKQRYDILTGFKNEGKESYPDTTKKFVKEINKLTRISCIKPIRILAPLINKDKEDIITLGKNLGVEFDKTMSCYIGREKHCGYCLACQLRKAGFYWANINDPTAYLVTEKF